MKIKNCILSMALILGSCSDATLVAQVKSEQVKQAESNASEFKKALHCIRNWKQCDRKQRLKVIGYLSAALAGAAAVGIGGYLGLKRRQKPVEAASTAPAGPAVPVPGAAAEAAAAAEVEKAGLAVAEAEQREAALREAGRRAIEAEERGEKTPFIKGYEEVGEVLLQNPTLENLDKLVEYIQSKRAELGELNALSQRNWNSTWDRAQKFIKGYRDERHPAQWFLWEMTDTIQTLDNFIKSKGREKRR